MSNIFVLKHSQSNLFMLFNLKFDHRAYKSNASPASSASSRSCCSDWQLQTTLWSCTCKNCA